MLDTVNHRRIQNLCVCDTVTYRSRNGQRVQMQQIHLRQFLHHCRNSTRFIQILHVVCSCRAQLRNIRRTSTDLIKQRRRQLNSRLMCNRREMQNGIRRASDAHIDRDRIFKGLTRHNIPRADILFNKFKNNRPCMLCQQTTLSCVRSGNRAVSGKPHTEHLGQGVHRVRREQAGAGTAAWAGMLLNSSHLAGIHLAGGKHPRCLECLTDTDVASTMTSGEHGAATDENGRDIETCRCHEHPRYNLIAVWNEDKPIESRCHGNSLDGIRNEFTAREGIFHPRMPHGNTVTNTDRRKFNRRSTSCCHSKFHGFRNCIQMKVPRDNLVERIANSDQRFSQILRTISVGMEQ